MQKEGSQIIVIDDIGNVVEISEEEADEQTMINASVVAIPNWILIDRCKARIEPTDDIIGRCSKSDCLMLQQYDMSKEQLSATIFNPILTSFHCLQMVQHYLK